MCHSVVENYNHILLRSLKNVTKILFAIILDQRHLQLTSVLDLYKEEGIERGVYLKHVIDLILDYIMTAEKRVNPHMKVTSKNMR